MGFQTIQGIMTTTRVLYIVGGALIILGLICFTVSLAITAYPNLLDIIAEHLGHPLSRFLRFPEHIIV